MLNSLAAIVDTKSVNLCSFLQVTSKATLVMTRDADSDSKDS